MSRVLTDVPGVGPSIAQALADHNISSVKKLAKIKIKKLTRVPGIGETTGKRMIQAAQDLRAADRSNKNVKKKRGKDKNGNKTKKKAK